MSRRAVNISVSGQTVWVVTHCDHWHGVINPHPEASYPVAVFSTKEQAFSWAEEHTDPDLKGVVAYEVSELVVDQLPTGSASTTGQPEPAESPRSDEPGPAAPPPPNDLPGLVRCRACNGTGTVQESIAYHPYQIERACPVCGGVPLAPRSTD